jgi:HEAT repeat protein
LLISVTITAAQVPFDEAVAALANADAAARLRTIRMLKDAAYPEAALPLARLVTDPDDAVQLEAIGAELNIFLAEKVVTRRRVGLVIEQRGVVAADALFDTGPLAIGPRRVPLEVLNALRTAARDDNPRVRLEAVYAFGVLGVEPRGPRRRGRALRRRCA